MSERKYREVTVDDLGKIIEATNDPPAHESRQWCSRWLWYIDRDRKHPFKVFGVVDEAFRYARIEVTDDPT